MKYYKVCRVKCLVCNDLLAYENSSKKDDGPGRVLICSCGRVGLDPSAVAYRVMAFPPGTPDDVEDLSVEWPEEDITGDIFTDGSDQGVQEECEAID